MKRELDILLLGIGNPGRTDDGLGPAFVSKLEQDNFCKIDLDSKYQLQIEDALLFSHYQKIIIVDASKADIEYFSFGQLKSKSNSQFSSHALDCPSVMALCEEIYQKSPDVFLLQIKGQEWGLGTSLSGHAKENLELALEFFYREEIYSKTVKLSSTIC